MDPIRLIARPLIAAPLIMEGWSALRKPDSHVEKARIILPILRGTGLQIDDRTLRLASRSLGAVTIAAGASLARGKYQRPAAALLAAVSIPIAFINNPINAGKNRLAKQANARDLLRSLSLAGGLLITSLDRQGKPSGKWKRRARREHIAALEQARKKMWEEAKQVYSA